MAAYLWVAVGSALGGMARYWMTIAFAAVNPNFPWGTIVINILGSFVIGFFATLSGDGGRLGVPIEIRTFVLTGLCGGFTTFSAFSLQTLMLARDGRWGQAAANVALSLALSLAAVTLGFLAAAAINGAARSAT
jgi:CrcB protein